MKFFKGKVLAGFLLTLLGLLAIGYLADRVYSQGRLPHGTTVVGVKIGDLKPADAVATLQAADPDVARQRVTLSSGERSAQFVPAEVGITPDWEATVARIMQPKWNPLRSIAGLFTQVTEPPVAAFDEPKLHDAALPLAQALSKEPVQAAVTITPAGTLDVVRPVEGSTVEARDVISAMKESWYLPVAQPVPAAVLAPEVSDRNLDQLLEGPAARAVAGDLVVHGRDDVTAVIPTSRLGEFVHFAADGARLHPELDVDHLRDALAEQLAPTVRPKKNATISFSGGAKQISPHQDGVSINWEATLAHIEDRVFGGANPPAAAAEHSTNPATAKEFDAIYADDPATFTTEDAQKATFDQVIGEFTTGGFSGPSGTNIALVARTVNGAIVAPGDTFSLNGYTGPRGKAQGYVESGVILNGRSDTAVGGGISQFATTLYNAAYFAGMEDITHTPHSFYISRYPAGREATVYEGAIDLVFRNTSPYPVRIDASVGGGQVTVRLLGVKTVNVQSTNGGRWAYTNPKPVKVSGDKCVPSSGSQGFTTSDTRTVRDLQGSIVSQQTWTTVYDPSPIVQCVG